MCSSPTKASSLLVWLVGSQWVTVSPVLVSRVGDISAFESSGGCGEWHLPGEAETLWLFKRCTLDLPALRRPQRVTWKHVRWQLKPSQGHAILTIVLFPAVPLSLSAALTLSISGVFHFCRSPMAPHFYLFRLFSCNHFLQPQEGLNSSGWWS